MMVYYDHDRTYPTARLHPYGSAGPEQSGHVDFKAHPELIPEALEDFRPFQDMPAVQTFYSFLAWINGSSSRLESNDCALRPPTRHQDTNSRLLLCIHGRIGLLFRDPILNGSKRHAGWLFSSLMARLDATDRELTQEEGVVGITRNPILQVAISRGVWRPDGTFEAREDDPGHGEEQMLTFWAYGDGGDEAFANLGRVFANIWVACRGVNEEIL